MINRIILIGNGFDLAHGLPTSYKDFINDYWENWAHILYHTNSNTASDGLTKITYNNTEGLWCNIIGHFMAGYGPIKKVPGKYIIESIIADTENCKIRMCPFFKAINKSIEEKNWVDIETEYYLLLKMLMKSGDKHYQNPQDLDKELNIIKSMLVAYLSKIQEERISSSLTDRIIEKIIFEPICPDDISIQGQEAFQKFLQYKWDDAQSEDESERRQVSHNYGIDYFYFRSEIESYKRDNTELSKHIKKIMGNEQNIARYYHLPDQILLLNFNYTKTADLYISQGSQFNVNHIHGELGNDNNPIIFGYGDELDEDYKSIANLNDNEYLKNIKSIRYLETDNYRQLLRFIDSAPYQIYIMGHSCGNSDRTLLNTLFEHRNCLSIKPYYHKKADCTDNYIDIVQNISRDFNDMTLMRDRVVNKGYCRPLVEPAP